MIRAVVVDDERLGREGIIRLSEGIPDLEVVDECATGAEALESINALRPDLIFLDIEMPELSGFDLLSEVDPNLMPEVVFVTAYDEYAVRAFEVNAVDYLLKPVKREELHRAVDRVRSRLSRGDATRATSSATSRATSRATHATAGGGWRRGSGAGAARTDGSGRFLQRLLARDRDRAFFVPAEDILWLAAAANYVRVATRGGKAFLIRGTLAELDGRLDPRRFLRVHRSTIVNLDHVREVRRDEMHNYTAVTADGRAHRVSRSARKALLGHH